MQSSFEFSFLGFTMIAAGGWLGLVFGTDSFYGNPLVLYISSAMIVIGIVLVLAPTTHLDK
jgi:hypothetical protein